MQILAVPESSLALCLIKEILSVSLEMLDNVEWTLLKSVLSCLSLELGKAVPRSSVWTEVTQPLLLSPEDISAWISHFGSSCLLSCCIICKPCILSLAWFTKGNCDFMWWLIRDKSAQQELSVPVWCSVSYCCNCCIWADEQAKIAEFGT